MSDSSASTVVKLTRSGRGDDVSSCRPGIGLHTVGNTVDRELVQVPRTQVVFLQRCRICGVALNRVSKHKGVLLPGGCHVLVHWVWPMTLVLGPADMRRLHTMPEGRAMEFLRTKVWGGLHFIDPPDISKHPSAVGARVAAGGGLEGEGREGEALWR